LVDVAQLAEPTHVVGEVLHPALFIQKGGNGCVRLKAL
jgi:hypothetical protein